eukprot:g11504.t1
MNPKVKKFLKGNTNIFVHRRSFVAIQKYVASQKTQYSSARKKANKGSGSAAEPEGPKSALYKARHRVWGDSPACSYPDSTYVFHGLPQQSSLSPPSSRCRDGSRASAAVGSRGAVDVSPPLSEGTPLQQDNDSGGGVNGGGGDEGYFSQCSYRTAGEEDDYDVEMRLSLPPWRPLRCMTWTMTNLPPARGKEGQGRVGAGNVRPAALPVIGAATGTERRGWRRSMQEL